MGDKTRIGIVGVSGYGGGELVRLLAGHPQAELTYATSGTYAGKPLSAALPGVARRVDLVCEKFDTAAAIERCDIVFLAGEAGLAMEAAPALLAAGKKVIDLSADFRLKDVAAYQTWYKREHTAQSWLAEAVYGLPELYRDQIKTASLIANPGCYVTSATLALAPLLSAKAIDPATIIIDSHSGVSGAGRSKFGLDYHFSEVNESIRPYGVGGTHRHVPEIEQNLSDVAGTPITVTFTPHLAPITRGILTTAYATLSPPPAPPVPEGVKEKNQPSTTFPLAPPPVPEGVKEKNQPSTTFPLAPPSGRGGGWGVGSLHALFTEFYADEPFVVVLEPGQYPATKWTEGTNYCYIGVGIDERTGRVIVVSAIDNLVKGAAGQAVQNLNLMCGWDETAGLDMPAVWP